MNVYRTFMIVALLAMIILVAGCVGSKDNISGNAIASDTKSLDIQKLEIIHFHATQQCITCINVGKYAEETVNTYFADEVKSGKITFTSLNVELSENQVLVQKYGVTGSSLWLGTYTKDGKFLAEQNTNVWYKTGNRTDYMIYLNGIIEQKLAGK